MICDGVAAGQAVTRSVRPDCLIALELFLILVCVLLQ